MIFDMTELPVFAYLDKNGIEHRRLQFSPDTEKGAANVAKALGFAERAMVKTLIFEIDKGECALIMVGGDQNAISGQLKKALGSRNIKMASPEKVVQVTGYVIGSIPPFSWQPIGFRTIIDNALMKEPELGVGTGQWGEEIMITPQNLQLASKGLVFNLTERDQPQ